MSEAAEVHVVECASEELERWADQWFDSWFEAYDAGTAHGRLDPVRPMREETLTSLRRPRAAYQKVLVSAVEQGRVVGGAVLDLPLLDNRTLLELDLAVAPAARRRGHGTALLRAVRDVAKQHGRTSLLACTHRPPASVDWPGSRFLERYGFQVALADVRRDLPLPPDAGTLDALESETVGYAAGYRFEAWSGRTPQDRLDTMAALMARMSTDAPLGTLDYEPEAWDAARVRDFEQRQEELGRRWWTRVAVAPDGEWVGYTQLGWTAQDPTRLYQWDTLVTTAHRGHRLGLLLKLGLLRTVLPLAPAATKVTTWNAASNGPMIAVNEAIGYRVAEVSQEWQADVGAVRL